MSAILHQLHGLTKDEITTMQGYKFCDRGGEKCKGYRIKNPAASGRGIEADLLPNPRFGLQALELRRRAAGNMSPTRFKG